MSIALYYNGLHIVVQDSFSYTTKVQKRFLMTAYQCTCCHVIYKVHECVTRIAKRCYKSMYWVFAGTDCSTSRLGGAHSVRHVVGEVFATQNCC